MLLDLEAERDDDHVLAIYRVRGHWGAVARSNFSRLRYREPVCCTLRELTMSYFKHYFNLRREKTLRRYSRPVNLKRFDRLGWMTAEAYVWAVPEHLWKIAHSPLVPTAPAEIDRQTWTSVYSWPSYWGGWDRKSAGSADFGWIIGDYGLLARHDARERQDKSLGVIW